MRSLCTRGIVLAGGALQFAGAVDRHHRKVPVGAVDRGEHDGQVSCGRAGLTFDDLPPRAVRLRNEAGEVRPLFDAAEPITVEIEYEFTARLRGARTVITLSTPEGEVAFQSTDQQTRDAELQPGRYLTACTIPGALLNGRMYVVEVGFDIPSGRMLAPARPYLSVVVAGATDHGAALWAGHRKSAAQLGDQLGPDTAIRQRPPARTVHTQDQSLFACVTRVSSNVA